MNARTAIFSLVSIRPHSIQEIGGKLPYSIRTVYKYVEELVNEGLLVKRGRGDETVLTIAEGYGPQKLREIHIQSLAHGIDPEMLMRESTHVVWESLDGPKTVPDIEAETSLSRRWILVILGILERGGLITYEKRRPIKAVLNDEHPLNRLLRAFYKSNEGEEGVYHFGTKPFEEFLKTPEDIERTLFERIDQDLMVRDTGFMVGGKSGRLTILESIEKGEGVEEIFIRKLMTTEGVEDICVDMIAQKRLDYGRLLELAIEKDIVSIVGCYLEIINHIKELAPPEVVERFHSNRSRGRAVFLPQERRYGKSGWEEPFELRWNVDLYLDLGAIMHGVRKW